MKIIILILGLMFASCATKFVYIVQRDVPEKPIFTVLPISDYLNQIEFSTAVEQYLMSAGVKIIQPPSSKAVETKRNIGGAIGNVQLDKNEVRVADEQGSQTLIERYSALHETKADYIVETNSISRQVKIIAKSTQEIVAGFSLPITMVKDENEQYEKDRVVVLETLKKLGVKVRENK
ncbi:MAG: hypothetical protein Q8L88_12515 [Bacteroidota bacterium]|nr:hypothetical protein [Bacteroidota bacterium]